MSLSPEGGRRGAVPAPLGKGKNTEDEMKEVDRMGWHVVVGAIVAVAAAQFAAAVEPKGVPELMTAFDGKTKIETVAQWEGVRAPELLERFTRCEYGRRPVDRPDTLAFELAEPDKLMMDGKAIRKRVRVSWKGPLASQSFVFTAFIPVTAKERPAPGFILICNRPAAENIDPERVKKSGFWPAERIVERGYAALAFWNGDVAPDDSKGNCSKGVHACWAKERTAESWGALSAWAWGASRVMDWIETEPLLDAKHVAVVGHSRGGKTALVAGVYDRRFAMACSNCSGCSGAKLNHIALPKSESVARISKTFPHWFCLNYANFAGKEFEMDFDQHEFIALIAPRLVCVASATKDYWAGQRGEWWSAKLASPAWELYGRRGLVAESFPKPDAPQQDGCVSYHIRTGIHNLTPYDWDRYMDFADRHGWRK